MLNHTRVHTQENATVVTVAAVAKLIITGYDRIVVSSLEVLEVIMLIRKDGDWLDIGCVDLGVGVVFLCALTMSTSLMDCTSARKRRTI